VVLVHRWKQYLYKIDTDHTKGDQLITFDISRGLTGSVALQGQTIWSEEITTAAKTFDAGLDDFGNQTSVAPTELLTVPVFTKEDRELFGDPEYPKFPRAVIHLISRRQEPVFTVQDRYKLEQVAEAIGYCHQNIQKVEQLHSMKYLSESMLSLNDDVKQVIESHSLNYQVVSKAI
jgi:hypothetical protein